MKATHAIPAIAALALAACATAGQRDVPGCREGPCTTIGKPIAVGEIIVTPTEVLEDSRCPIEAECVWEGQVRITALVEHDGIAEPVELILDEPIPIGSGMLSFAEIAPDMSNEWAPLQAEDYEFGFRHVPHIMDEPAENAN